MLPRPIFVFRRTRAPLLVISIRVVPSQRERFRIIAITHGRYLTSVRMLHAGLRRDVNHILAASFQNLFLFLISFNRIINLSLGRTGSDAFRPSDDGVAFFRNQHNTPSPEHDAYLPSKFSLLTRSFNLGNSTSRLSER